MSPSNSITGREIILGVKKATTWRDAVDVGANDGVLITSEGIGAKAPNFIDDDSLGNPDILETYKVNENAHGRTVEGKLRYEGWEVMLALAMGTAGSPTGSAMYAHTLYPADNIRDKFATVAMKKAGTSKGIWEIPSATFHGFTITGNVGELATISMNFSGNKIETENPENTSLSSVTYPDKKNVVLMDDDFQCWMNAQAGGALAIGDVLYPHGFTFTYNRPMSEDYQASYTDMAQPEQDGFAEITIELRFDKYNIDTFTTAIATAARQKMHLLFQGGTISGSGDLYQFRIDLANIEWMSADAPVSGPGKIPHTVTGKCLSVTAAPTGMTSLVDPFRIYIQNARSTDPLA